MKLLRLALAESNNTTLVSLFRNSCFATHVEHCLCNGGGGQGRIGLQWIE